MRKILYIALVSLSVNAFAQDEVLTTTEESSSASSNVSINGKQITPEAGDMGLGFNASNILGDLLAANGNGNPSAVSVGGTQEIFLRYFLADDMALRVSLGIGQVATTTTRKVVQDKQNDPNLFVDDNYTTSNGTFGLGVGVEMRRGSGRVQGYYGGELAFNRSNFSEIREYGNMMTVDNQSPTTAFGTGNSRMIASYGNTNYGVNLNGIIGAEVFIGPKISLGGEFSTGLRYSKTVAGESQFEEMSDDGIEYDINPNATSFSRGWGTAASGGIFANFYF